LSKKKKKSLKLQSLST